MYTSYITRYLKDQSIRRTSVGISNSKDTELENMVSLPDVQSSALFVKVLVMCSAPSTLEPANLPFPLMISALFLVATASVYLQL